ASSASRSERSGAAAALVLLAAAAGARGVATGLLALERLADAFLAPLGLEQADGLVHRPRVADDVDDLLREVELARLGAREPREHEQAGLQLPDVVQERPRELEVDDAREILRDVFLPFPAELRAQRLDDAKEDLSPDRHDGWVGALGLLEEHRDDGVEELAHGLVARIFLDRERARARQRLPHLGPELLVREPEHRRR